MSGAEQQQPTQPPAKQPVKQQNANLSGSFSRLRPWQIAVISVAIIFVIWLLPNVVHYVSLAQHHERQEAVNMAQAASAPWTPPPPDQVEKAVATTAAVPDIAKASRPAASQMGSASIPDARMLGQKQQPQPPQNVRQASMVSGGGAGGASNETEMARRLKPTSTHGFRAHRIEHPWATIEAGREIACHTVPRMTSQLPGFVTAKIDHNVKGYDGTTTLINRNATVLGEIQRGLVDGQDRVFVLWREIDNPSPAAVTIEIDSPGADEMGESGLPGDVDHHTLHKIGGAVLLSGIETGLQGASLALSSLFQHGNSGNNLNFYNLQGNGQSLAQDLLRNRINIPDTLHRDEALPCSIIVAGQLDFSDVYTLEVSR